MVGNACSAVNCSNRKEKMPHMSFFRVPKNAERSKKWIINSRRKDLEDKSVQYCNTNIKFCADHFLKTMFIDPLCSKLVWNAEPTIFKIPNPPPTPSIAITRRPLHRMTTLNCKKEKQGGIYIK
jgi:hypothetical protein